MESRPAVPACSPDGRWVYYEEPDVEWDVSDFRGWWNERTCRGNDFSSLRKCDRMDQIFLSDGKLLVLTVAKPDPVSVLEGKFAIVALNSEIGPLRMLEA